MPRRTAATATIGPVRNRVNGAASNLQAASHYPSRHEAICILKGPALKLDSDGAVKEGGWGTGESGVEWLIRSPCSMDFSRNRYQQQSMSRERRTSSQCSFTVQLQAVCSTAAVLPTLLLMFRATGFFFYACACVWIDCHYRSALGTVLNDRRSALVSELRSCVNRELGLGCHSLFHFPPVPNKSDGFCGRKAT